ncbi:hypothetical protein CMI42_00545 [Candidatus Pacearchaeota archaeon]|nr:hypothetical protein [Candidatus Pacearchaeota archaeon]|tara:strand:+ start:1308 stop:1997 length:690 start_codon:yes stop_codon:yes gene_type:complete
MITFKIISKKDYEKSNKKPNQEKVWNSIAKPWKTYVVKKIPIVEEFLKDKKGKVIDLGCGTGRNMIPNKNIEYTGIDFSSDQLKQAKKYISKNKINAKLIKAQAHNLKNIKSKTFHQGLFIATLHCIETKENREKALKEFQRVLKKNATALISVWNSKDKRFNKVNNQGSIYMSWKEQGVPYMRYYYLYKKQELKNLLEKTGFKIIKTYRSRKKDRFSRKNWIFEIKKV